MLSTHPSTAVETNAIPTELTRLRIDNINVTKKNEYEKLDSISRSKQRISSTMDV
jgi:hypothetical protein